MMKRIKQGDNEMVDEMVDEYGGVNEKFSNTLLEELEQYPFIFACLKRQLRGENHLITIYNFDTLLDELKKIKNHNNDLYFIY